MKHSSTKLIASLETGGVRRALISLLIALVLAGSGLVYVSPVSADLARSGSTVLVSAFPDGSPADGGEPSVSADGRYIAFASWDRLLPDARDNCQEVYRKDMATGDLLRVSADKPCNSFKPSISADGNKVLYLWGGCIRGVQINACFGYRAYVRDIAAGTTITVSDTNRSVEYAKLSSDGNYAVLLHSDGWDVWGAQVRDVNNPSNVWHIGSIGLSVPDYTADISADGRYAVFESDASHVPQDTDDDPDVYLFDRVTNAKSLVGIHPSGEARRARQPAISADGSTVAFTSSEVVEQSLVGNIYARKLQSGVTTLVSQSNLGAPSLLRQSVRVSLSADGDLITFNTLAPHLSVDLNPSSDVYLRDMSSGSTSLVSVLPDGTQGPWYYSTADISDNGRFVAFQSKLEYDLPNERRVYLRDLQPSCSLAVCPLDYP